MLRVIYWALPRRRQLIAIIIAVVAALLVVNGIGSLLMRVARQSS